MGLPAENIYLLQDDLDSKLAKLRIKESGSAL
jgi:peptidyl-tRNA hydrolase